MQNLSGILVYALMTFGIAIVLYPLYIRLLKQWKFGKTIREDDISGQKALIFNELHKHKAWTPTMWWGLLLIMMVIMIIGSFVAQYMWFTRFSLVSQKETFVILGWFFGMGLLWLVDDIWNIRGIGKVKGLTAWVKLSAMVIISWSISLFFYIKLGMDWVHISPMFVSRWHSSASDIVTIGRLFVPLTFLITIWLTNAINITDWLDWLVGGLMLMVLGVLAGTTFAYERYLATTVLAVVMATLVAFLWYNIYPAKVFMWDSGAFALWWLLATTVYLLNFKVNIIGPFIVLCAIFWIELFSSFLQIVWKKYVGKKLFVIAPFHHLLQYWWWHETTIVMRMWLIQWVLAVVAGLMMFYG